MVIHVHVTHTFNFCTCYIASASLAASPCVEVRISLGWIVCKPTIPWEVMCILTLPDITLRFLMLSGSWFSMCDLFFSLWEFSGFLSHQCFEISVTFFVILVVVLSSVTRHFQSWHLYFLVLGNFSESFLW